MKKLIFIFLAALALTGCTGKNNQEKIVLSMAFQAAEGTVQYDSAMKFKELVNEKSNGTMDVRLYPSGQLGSDRELIESTQFGDVSIVLAANSPLVPFMSEFGVFDAPMIFAGKDSEEILKIFRDSEFRENLNEISRQKGFELISLNCNDQYREMSSNIPVYSMEDFSKIRIRTMDNKYHMQFWKNLGASPTPIAFSELYLSLQQGLIDAQENPYEVLIYTGIHEQQKYIINTDHCLFVTTAMMNKELYDSLTEEQKITLAEAIEGYEDFTNELTNASLAKQVEQLTTQNGMEVIDPPIELLEEMKEKAEPVYTTISEDIGEQWIGTLKEELDKIN